MVWGQPGGIGAGVLQGMLHQGAVRRGGPEDCQVHASVYECCIIAVWCVPFMGSMDSKNHPKGRAIKGDEPQSVPTVLLLFLSCNRLWFLLKTSDKTMLYKSDICSLFLFFRPCFFFFFVLVIFYSYCLFYVLLSLGYVNPVDNDHGCPWGTNSSATINRDKMNDAHPWTAVQISGRLKSIPKRTRRRVVFPCAHGSGMYFLRAFMHHSDLEARNRTCCLGAY